MDFLHKNANNQPQAPRGDHGGTIFNQAGGAGKMKQLMGGNEPSWLRVVFVVLLFSLTILAVAIALLMYFGKSNENDSVDKAKYQAVFLTNGQVYFGKVKNLNGQYVDLREIYYLNSQEQSAEGNTANKEASTNFSLIKLGCELHGPTDKMVINREQVTFWENLKTEGKVAKAIAEWRKQNPDGQNCKTDTGTTQQSGTGANTGTESKQAETQN